MPLREVKKINLRLYVIKEVLGELLGIATGMLQVLKIRDLNAITTTDMKGHLKCIKASFLDAYKNLLLIKGRSISLSL